MVTVGEFSLRDLSITYWDFGSLGSPYFWLLLGSQLYSLSQANYNDLELVVTGQVNVLVPLLLGGLNFPSLRLLTGGFHSPELDYF